MAERRIRPDEETLWNTVTQSVDPIDSNKRNKNTGIEDVETEAPPEPAFRPKQTQRRAPIQQARVSPRPETPSDPNAGIDKRTRGRLKKGKMSIDARIDLHGHTRDSAHRALTAFLEAAYERQNRCVLVITGKGYGTSEGRVEGVLKQAVPGWLSSGKLKPMIVSWQEAQPRDGGSGALYVLIKRRR